MPHPTRPPFVGTLLFFALCLSAPALAQTVDDEPPEPAEPEEKSQQKKKAKEKKTQAPASPRQVWDLDDLRARGVKHAASLKVERAKQKNAAWKVFRAKYAWAPRLNATTTLAPVPANTDPNKLSRNVDEILNLNIGPFIRQQGELIVPIYTFGRIAAARKLAGINSENVQTEYRKALLDLDFQIKRAYWGIRLARAYDEILADGQKLIDDQLLEMQEKRDFGETDFRIADFRRLQIFATEFGGRKLDNEKLKILGVEGLDYLTGVRVNPEEIAPFSEDEEIPTLASFEHYRNVAMSQRPEVAQLRYAIAARAAQVDERFAAMMPNIFFAANFTYGYSTESVARQKVDRLIGTQWVETDLAARPWSNAYDQFSIGVALGLRWELDFIQDFGQYKEAQANQEQIVAQQEQALGAIELEIKSLYLDAMQGREKVQLGRRRLQAAERWRNQMGLSAQNAGNPEADAIAALRSYYEAKVLYLGAMLSYFIARADLAKGIGVLRLEDAGLDTAVLKKNAVKEDAEALDIE